MAAASLALSIVALLVSASGLGWTIFEWKRSGARLKVKSTSFMTFGPPAGNQWFIGIDVTNTGRTPTTVNTVGFLRGKKAGAFVQPTPAIGPNPLPARLEPGESFVYPMSIDGLADACEEGGNDPLTVIPYANSGHGMFTGAHDSSARSVIQSEISKRTTVASDDA